MKIGFSGLLTLIFITLKLCSVIDWSWWWVLSPLWISLIVGFLVGCLAFWAETPERKLVRELRSLGLK